jgi:glycosyltransferase involved in cell wall biosynthesis
MKAACIQMALEASDWNVTPTSFQKSSFPAMWREKISTIHDGIDIHQAKPNPSASPFKVSDKKTLHQGQPIVTFVNRVIEPYRGCHTFIRAIPAILANTPTAEIVVVGAERGQSYGISPKSGKSWKEIFLEEIDGSYNSNQVHFVGNLAYQRYLHLLQLSAAHVYLTYPFVLSWSFLEAMSTACPIIGSSTPPVEEVLKHEKNGLLCDFFNPEELAQSVQVLLENRILAKKLGCAARETILKKYSLETCVNNHINLIKLVKGGSIVS